jgi:hypothetical protein
MPGPTMARETQLDVCPFAFRAQDQGFAAATQSSSLTAAETTPH